MFERSKEICALFADLRIPKREKLVFPITNLDTMKQGIPDSIEQLILSVAA